MDEPFKYSFLSSTNLTKFWDLEGKDLSGVEAQEWSLKKVRFDKLQTCISITKTMFCQVFLVALEKNWDEI
jgi:hypothetical protein